MVINKDELAKMKKYHEMTIVDGLDMPSLEIFDQKVKMAIMLWPQKNNDGSINYLFGKGIGVELALRGEVKGYEKNNNNFPYRSHSDFEIYNSNGYLGEDADNFKFVFGSQEIYDKTTTKGLHDMEPDLMDNTYETVLYEGNEYLIPDLEILFLDKFLKMESSAGMRQEGSDAELLLREYKLDLDKIKYYFQKYCIEPKLKNNPFNVEAIYTKQIESLNTRFLEFIKNLILEDGCDLSLPNINQTAQKEIQNGMGWGGVTIQYCPLDLNYVIDNEGNFVVSEESKDKIRTLIKEHEYDREKEFREIIENIEKMYNLIYPNDLKR